MDVLRLPQAFFLSVLLISPLTLYDADQEYVVNDIPGINFDIFVLKIQRAMRMLTHPD